MRLKQAVIVLVVLLTIGCGGNLPISNQQGPPSPPNSQVSLSGYWNLTLHTTKYNVTQNFAVLIAPSAVTNEYALEFLGLPTPYTQTNSQPLYWCAPVNVEPLDGFVTSSNGSVNFQLVGFAGDAFNFTGTINVNSISGSFSDNGGGCTNGDTTTWQAGRTSSTMNLAGVWQFTSHSNTFNTAETGSGSVQQNGTAVSGTLTLSGTPCSIDAFLSASVSGNVVTGQLQEGAQAVSITGTVYGDASAFTSPTGGLTITGTYTSPSGGCLNGDQGTWSATKT
jgi:hypothetical protein